MGISGLGRVRVGGNLNNRLPAYALLCLAPALLVRATRGQPLPWPAPTGAWRVGRLGRWRAPSCCNLAWGSTTRRAIFLLAAMRAAGDRLVARIAAVPGPVLVLMHPYYALLAGKAPATQIATLWYVRDRGALPLPADFVSRLDTHAYAEIISDQSDFEVDPALQELLARTYVPAQTLDASQAPATMVGVVVRPQVVYVPRVP